MFNYLTGRLVEKNPAYLVLENNGIGYKITTPTSTYEKLPSGGEIKIFTEIVLQSSLSEISLQLYGFYTLEERRLFQYLKMVQRVGPSTALRILSRISVSEFRQAVISGNIRLLEKIKGIGNKTAQRIILELKEPLSLWALPAPSAAAPESDHGPVITDAVLALVSLGYPRMAAEQAVREAMTNIPAEFNTENLVKKALQMV